MICLKINSCQTDLRDRQILSESRIKLKYRFCYTWSVSKLQIKVFLVLILASGLLMFLDSKNMLSPVKNIVETVTAPVQFGLYQGKLGVNNFFSFITFWKSGEARIKNLELRNLELAEFKNKAEILERENRDLRKQLGATVSAVKKLLPVTVVGLGQYLEIYEGGFEGKTVVYLGNLVGKIVKAHFIQLPTDSASKIPVRVGKVLGLAYGQFNSTIILDKVAQNEEIKIDDLVVTADEGLIVGKIKKITSKQTDLFQTAEVTPLIDYEKLETVFIIERE